MITQTTGQKKALQDLQDYWEYAKDSDVRKAWLESYEKNLKIYCGEFWDESVLDGFRQINATPYSINRIEPLVNAYSSLQIQSNKRIGFKATTDIVSHETLADYLSYMAHVIQTQNDFPFYSSQKYTSALIGGLGWSHFGYDDGKFFYDFVDPREVYFDPDDQSPRLEESSFVCRSYYVSIVTLKNRYPKHAEYLEGLLSDRRAPASMTANNLSEDDSWTRGRSIRIVEIFYKKQSEYFEGTTLLEPENQESAIGSEQMEAPTEQIFTTFDYELAKSKAINSVTTKTGTQIFKGAFCADILLEHGSIAHQVPNQKHFPLLPLALRRNHLGVPYGVVDNLVPILKALNYIWTKTIHGIDQKILIVTGNNDTDALEEKWIQKLQQKIAVIATTSTADAKLHTPEQTLPYFFDLLKRIDIEFEQCTYLFDELKGNQTNAVSGVAIAQRAANSAKVQNPLNMAYDHLLLSEGQLLLDTVKGLGSELHYTFNYYKDGKHSLKNIDNAVCSMNFEVYTDVVPNFASSVEEERAKFAEVLSSPNPGMAMSSPLFLKKLNLRDYEELAEEYARITGLTQQAEQEAQIAQQGAQAA